MDGKRAEMRGPRFPGSYREKRPRIDRCASREPERQSPGRRCRIGKPAGQVVVGEGWELQAVGVMGRGEGNRSAIGTPGGLSPSEG